MESNVKETNAPSITENSIKKAATRTVSWKKFIENHFVLVMCEILPLLFASWMVSSVRWFRGCFFLQYLLETAILCHHHEQQQHKLNQQHRENCNITSTQHIQHIVQCTWKLFLSVVISIRVPVSLSLSPIQDTRKRSLFQVKDTYKHILSLSFSRKFTHSKVFHCI